MKKGSRGGILGPAMGLLTLEWHGGPRDWSISQGIYPGAPRKKRSPLHGIVPLQRAPSERPRRAVYHARPRLSSSGMVYALQECAPPNPMETCGPALALLLILSPFFEQIDVEGTELQHGEHAQLWMLVAGEGFVETPSMYFVYDGRSLRAKAIV